MRVSRLLEFAKKALLFELALYGALARWIVRRPDVPSGATPIGYSQLVGPMLWLWIFGSATEVVVIEVVLRHVEAGWAEAVRLPLLVLGVWGLLWMLGLLAAFRVRPHLLHADRIRIRGGARAWVDVRLDAVAGIRVDGHELPGLIRSVHQEGGLLLVGVGSETNLELVLTGSTLLQTSDGERSADRVGWWVDDPRDIASRVRALTVA